jgi:transketolase
MDYGRNAVRMAALMGIRVIFVFSHDSIALGEDGPTHQPIEQLTTLRSTPNMTTWRPANLAETAVAWKEALSKTDGPTSIILSRQNLAPFASKEFEQLKIGGYFVTKRNDATVNLIATGSEVGLAIEVEKLLYADGVNCNVASVPCLEALLKNKNQYKEIFSLKTINIVIECGHPNSWFEHTQNVIGINSFGESGKGNDLMDHFGFTPEKIKKKIKQMI